MLDKKEKELWSHILDESDCGGGQGVDFTLRKEMILTKTPTWTQNWIRVLVLPLCMWLDHLSWF
jgi:hypothetical protein